ncbi:MAG: hypothetical protein ACTHLE_07235 [Agriterribacter sp.]
MFDIYNRNNPELSTQKNILISEAELTALTGRIKKTYTATKRERFYESLPGEKWLELPGTYGIYEVSNLGRLIKHTCCDQRGNKVPYLVNPKIYDGFHQHLLTLPAGTRRIYVHKAVKETFEPTKDKKIKFVYHLNGCKTDNRLCNLAYRAKEKTKKAKLKTKVVVNKYNDLLHKKSSLSVGDLQKIKEQLALGVPQNQIAEQFNISQAYVSRLKRAGIRIVNGKVYSYFKHLNEA